MATPFDDVRLPEDIERGAEIGPRFQTSVIPLTSGREVRNQDWTQERLEANIGYGMMRNVEEVEYDDGELERTFTSVMAFFRARRGQLRGFRFKDWSDYSIEAELIGVGDGFNDLFQLAVGYDTYVRRITRPVLDSINVYLDDVSTNAWSLDPLGIINMNVAPLSGVEVKVDFEFDIPVRFASDIQLVQLEWAKAGSVPDIKLIGLRE